MLLLATRVGGAASAAAGPSARPEKKRRKTGRLAKGQMLSSTNGVTAIVYVV